jgi:hypothetical protein
VENSKKIVAIKDELSNKMEKPNLEFVNDLILDNGLEVEEDGIDDRNLDSPFLDDVNCDLILEEFGIHENMLQFNNISENSLGILNGEMKTMHVIPDPTTNTSSVVINEDGRDILEECDVNSQRLVSSNYIDVVRVVLNLEKITNYEEPKWVDLIEGQNLDFEEIPISRKSCIHHFKLDPKQEAAFNVICSSFMLGFLNDPTISKFGSNLDKEQATNILLQKGGCSRLIMHLTGSGGSGKSFVLNASRFFCKQFCKVTGQQFDESVLIVSATTNSVAAQVQGDTIHSLAGLRCKSSKNLRNGKVN